MFIFLRGGMDGLSAVPPYGDPQYAARRGALAVAAPGTPGGALDLDGHFGLSPYLAEMHKLYAARELAVLHAVASPYRERSHFDAQNLLENGTAKPFGRESGWLNVALGRPIARRRHALRHPGLRARARASRWCCAARRRSAPGRRPGCRCPTPICSSGWRRCTATMRCSAAPSRSRAKRRR